MKPAADLVAAARINGKTGFRDAMSRQGRFEFVSSSTASAGLRRVVSQASFRQGLCSCLTHRTRAVARPFGKHFFYDV